MSTPQERWQAFLQALNQQTPTDIFRTWYSELQFISYEAPNLYLSIPNAYFQEQFTKNYAKDFYQLLVSFFGANVQVLLRNREQMAEEQKKQQQLQEANTRPTARPAIDSRLPADYLLRTFVSGESNKTAYSMAKAIIAHPGALAFNPFFLFGASGVGKTHLAAAIGHEVLQKSPEKRVLFVSARDFQEQFTNASRTGRQNDFLAFYQTIDLLILDDVQELTTEKTQKTFFHIFNHLRQLGRQIIFTCDRLPNEIEGLQDRVLSRLQSGVTVQIDRPDIKLRKDILLARIRLDEIDGVSDEVVNYVAERISSNVRELHGVLNSLMAYAVANEGEITKDLMERIVSRYISMADEEITLDDIIAIVAKKHGLRRSDLRAKTRKKEVVCARQIAMYLCHKRGMSYSSIGKEFGKRDHSTVTYSCQQVDHLLRTDKEYRRQVEELEASLKCSH